MWGLRNQIYQLANDPDHTFGIQAAVFLKITPHFLAFLVGNVAECDPEKLS